MGIKVPKKPKINWKKEYDQLFRKYSRVAKAANGYQDAYFKMKKDRDNYRREYDRLIGVNSENCLTCNGTFSIMVNQINPFGRKLKKDNYCRECGRKLKEVTE